MLLEGLCLRGTLRHITPSTLRIKARARASARASARARARERERERETWDKLIVDNEVNIEPVDQGRHGNQTLFHQPRLRLSVCVCVCVCVYVGGGRVSRHGARGDDEASASR